MSLCWKAFTGFSLLWEQKTNSFPGLPLQLHLNPLLPHQTPAMQACFSFPEHPKLVLFLGLHTGCSIFLECSFPDELIFIFQIFTPTSPFFYGRNWLNPHQNVLFLDRYLSCISELLAWRRGCVSSPRQWKVSRSRWAFSTFSHHLLCLPGWPWGTCFENDGVKA